MDSTLSAPKRKLNVVRKDKTTQQTQKAKPLDFVIKPYPDDITKGKLDLQGAFRFHKAADAFEWAREVWSDPNNRMTAYVYRQIPVCNFNQSNTDPNPEQGHNISVWKTWPFSTTDYHVGMLETFGGGTYLILFHDPVAARKIAKIEEWELPNYENYPPKIRVDDVVLDSNKNRGFISWARNAGVLFPNDKGYEPGKFVHVETQRHKNLNEEDDYMTGSKSPIGQAVEQVTAGILTDAVENMRRPAPVIAPAPIGESLDHKAAVEAIGMVKDTAREMLNAKASEQTGLLSILQSVLEARNTPQPPPADTGVAVAMETAINAVREMSKLQIDMYRDQNQRLEQRLDRIERDRNAVAVAAAPPISPEDAAIAYLDKTTALMERLGYSRGRAPREIEAKPESILDKLLEFAPSLIEMGLGAYTTHMQATIRLAELQAAARTGVPAPPSVPIVTPPRANTATPADMPNIPTDAQRAAGPVNEAMRQQVGPQFDYYVNNFHDQLAKMDSVFSSKFIAAIQSLIADKIEDQAEQAEVMADFGAELATWYTEIPGNAHGILQSFEAEMPQILKTYKPIWDVMSKAPDILHAPFIAGFCHPERLDADEPDADDEDAPTRPIGPKAN